MQKKLTIFFIILILAEFVWAQQPLRNNTDLFFSEIHVNGEEQPSIRPGDTLWFTIRIENIGTTPFEDCNLTVSSADPYVTFLDSTEYFDYIAPGNSYLLHDCAACIISPAMPNNHFLNFSFKIHNTAEAAIDFRSYLTHSFDLNVLGYSISDNGNHNMLINPNETSDITFSVQNISEIDLNNVSFSLETEEPGITVMSSYLHKDIIYADEVFLYTVQLYAEQPFTDGRTFDVKINASTPDLGPSHCIVSIVGTDNCVDFEGGIIPSAMYGESSQVGWQIDYSNAYCGSASLRSGVISHYDSSTVNFPITLNHSDIVSFYYKTSSESNYDWLYFYVDDVQLGRWSGTNDWTRYEVNLASGTHLLTWRYIKDKSVNSGSDCVWIDHISIPTNEEISFSFDPPFVVANIELNSGTVAEQMILSNESNVPILFRSTIRDLQGHPIGWASLYSPANGSVNAHEQRYLSLLINPQGYPIGDYDALLILTINEDDTVQVPITLHYYDGVGIIDLQTTEELAAYPNPTSGTVYIDNTDFMIKDLTLYDIYGNLISSPPISFGEKIKIDLSFLPANCYFIQAKYEDGSHARQKVVKK